MISEIRQAHFPVALTSAITAKPVASAQFWPVTSQLDAQIETPFGELGLYQQPKERGENGRFLRQINSQNHHEYFLFHNEENLPVGWSMGNMLDASTFFMSWSAILPAYQQQGVYSTFMQKLLPYLQTLGYERVTSKHMVTNRPVLIAKLKAGFHITGLTLDERFGAQVTLAYFFHADRLAGFSKAFSLEQYG